MTGVPARVDDVVDDEVLEQICVKNEVVSVKNRITGDVTGLIWLQTGPKSSRLSS